MATIVVDKAALQKAHAQMKSALALMDLLLADLGCLHPNAFDVTTMDGSSKTKSLCPDCGAMMEEEIALDNV